MLELYIAKGTSGLGTHILLEEAGADYETRWISFPDKGQQSPDFLGVNPKGRVPALVTPEGVLTENPAMLFWIAETYPEAGLMPATAYDRARAQALASFLCATVHVHFAHLLRGARWSDDPAAHESMKAKVPANLLEAAKLIEAHYLDGPWALGADYCFVDPYLILVSRWLLLNNVPLEEAPAIKAHTEALMARPATQRVLAAHGMEGPG
ncbi:MAG: glutathione S-transferase family protein [Pseudomonadota bacterium]